MRVLVVDDEEAIRLALGELVRADGHAVREAGSGDEALAALEGAPADLVLADLRMPGMDGMKLVETVRARHPDTLVVLITAQGDERTAVQALKRGAYDYLPKPFDNEEIRATIRHAHEVLSLREENRRLRRELAGEFRGMIGDSPAMREVAETIRRAGPTDATVLVTGESGTGKELAARAIHAESRRSAEPFVALNSSALPGELIESELFGHVRGAFTGADRDRTGVFEAAHRGTLFLDEVGDLSLSAQAKLLRVVEEGRVTPVGTTTSRPVDVRLVAATNRPLEEAAANGGFREDLLYRLQVVTLRLPPLRECRADIPALAVHFIAELAARHDRPVRSLSNAARRALVAYDWPGNVRELRNVLERAVVLADGDEMDVSALPARMSGAAVVPGPVDAALEGLPWTVARQRAVEGFERSFLAAALERHGGNVSATARALGLHRQSLQKMLRRLDIAP
ncbi:MAG TPA: sigma-54 dependent transcriptional regulator [Gemmatimonadota bacterium]